MDYGEPKTHLWNLSLAVTASLVLAACGPTVIPEGETETETAPTTETDPDATDTTAGPCVDASDCQPGEECIDGVCMPYGYYCDDGCCDDGCYYYQCYVDDDCGPMGLCLGGSQGCVYPEALPECEAVPTSVPLPLPPAPGTFVSMAFVDANGDAAQDLVISRDEGTELYLGGSELSPPVLLPLDPGLYALVTAAGDFDNDGAADLVFAVPPTSLVLLTGSGDGSFAPAQSLALERSPVEMVPRQWNGAGELELVTRDMTGSVALRRSEGGVFSQSEPLGTFGEVLSLVGFEHDGDAFDDVVAQGTASAEIFVGNEANDVTPDFELPGVVRGPRQLWRARMRPGPQDGLVGLTQLDGWNLLELWPSGDETPLLYALFDDGYDARVGDLDGDGVDDLVTFSALGLETGLSFLRGTNDPEPAFTCRSPYYDPGDFPLPFSYEVGDFDGDGKADLAVEVEGDVTIMLTQ